MNKFNKVITFMLSLIIAFATTISCMGEGTFPTSEDISAEFSSEESESTGSKIESDSEITTESESEEESSSEPESSNEPESSSEAESSSEEESSESEESSEEDPTPEPPAPPAYELILPENDSTSSYRLVKTKYETDVTIIANAVVTDFGADPTGEKDSTSAIQTAINRVSSRGGGTVFLPLGQYLVTSTITVPSYVSLVGDWNKPILDNTDGNFDYGTVILAKPKEITSASPKDTPLISLSNGSGLVGLTFYYVDQNAVLVKKFGYTVYGRQPSTATLKNLTFINSAYGIGFSLDSTYNELINIENVYGTFLYNAISHNGTTDVGFYDNINVSSKYWQNASDAFKCKYPTSLKKLVAENLEAVVLGDLDDQLISNVNIDGGKIGIKFTTGTRTDTGFWGLVHNANINCEKGVYADKLHATSGVVFTNSNVGLVENVAPAGYIKMSNSTYESVGTGVVQEKGTITKQVSLSPLSLKFSNHDKFFVANTLITGGNVDNTTILQNLLNTAGEAGGGVVVIPNGIYRLNSAITVPKNVEIRSTQSVFSRSIAPQSTNNGVIFITYATQNTFVLKDNAGAIGLRIWHARNDYLTAYDKLSNSSYSNDVSIKADGNGAYAYMNESVGAYVAYDFSNCDNHILKSNYGISYVNLIKAGGKNGVINQCLANPNFMTRTNVYNYFDSSIANVANWKKMADSGEANEDFFFFRDDIGRTYTKMVRLENAENEIALNVFCFGHAGLFDVVNSSATLVNTSLDYIKGTNFVYELTGGTCDIVGSLRVFGTSLKVNSGRMTAYGRIAFGEIKEQVYDSDVSLEDKIEYVSASAKRKTLFNCNIYTTQFNVSINYKSQYVIEGSGSWKWKSDTLEGKFNSVDISEYQNGYLHFYVYCSDVSTVKVGQIELTSSGTCDVNEANWNVDQYITKTGWNEIWLDLSAAGSTGGVVDLSNINYFRIYITGSSATFYIDNIEVVTD